jgi:hypothetical protein
MKYLNKFNLLIQKNLAVFVIIVCLFLIIINTIWFSVMDPNETIKNSFNRTTIETNNKKLKFISDPFTDACHYTFTTMSTVGYGDITPKSTAAKYWTMFMHIIAIFISLRLFDYYISDESSNKALIDQMTQLEKSKKEYEDKNKILEDKNKILEDKNIEINKLLDDKNKLLQNSAIVSKLLSKTKNNKINPTLTPTTE